MFTNRFDKIIRVCFYLIFFLTPIVMYPSTYELFEFNKMWLVFILTIVIGFFWFAKMITAGRMIFRRTPFDVPLFLFLISQAVSTLFSIEPHVSVWGYYSRFNGGLLSLACYLFLYWAFVSNCFCEAKIAGLSITGVKSLFSRSNYVSIKIVVVNILSGMFVALWGLPSHFGLDPTCLVFRGTFDVSCWTASFQPEIRMFSTLGQPNWLAAYLAVVLLFALGFLVQAVSRVDSKLKAPIGNNVSLQFLLIGVCTLELFYVDIVFTESQSGFGGLLFGFAIFLVLLILSRWRVHALNAGRILKRRDVRLSLSLLLLFLVTSFFIGQPITRLNSFTLSRILGRLTLQASRVKTIASALPTSNQPVSSNPLGGTDSGKIRLIVWRGALKLFEEHPLFGTGVETFAYAYYQARPKEHNLTSEWDFIYNKAHNEYLNYLATTGLFGFLTYMWFICLFLAVAVKEIIHKPDLPNKPVAIALVSAFCSLLFSNFFGFSVVIVNVYIFLIPALFLGITDYQGYAFAEGRGESKRMSTGNTPDSQTNDHSKPLKMAGVLLIFMTAVYLIFFLIRYWIADQSYSLGYNYNRAGVYSTAYQPLVDAATLVPSEDLYQDELSLNLAMLSLALYDNNQATAGAKLAFQAKALSDYIAANHPNNVIFYKTRIRVLYALSEINKRYLPETITAIRHAAALAPTDPKILYNMGLLYEQSGDTNRAVAAIGQSINLKPDYRDPRYGLALFYIQLAQKEEAADPQKARILRSKAKDQLDYILKYIDPSDKDAKTLLGTMK